MRFFDFLLRLHRGRGATAFIRTYYAAYFGMYVVGTFDEAHTWVESFPWAWPYLFALTTAICVLSLILPHNKKLVALALAVPAGLGVCAALAMLFSSGLYPDLTMRLARATTWLLPLVIALDVERAEVRKAL